MDARDRSIGSQVAFKGAIDLAVSYDLDLTDPEGQQKFELMFNHLADSLLTTMEVRTESGQVAQVIQGAFPGSTVVANGSPPPPEAYQPEYTQPGPPQFQLSIKGNQFGPIPAWLYEQAASKGVTEVYDNRDRASGTKRPWFRSTTGGENAPAFWPPR